MLFCAGAQGDFGQFPMMWAQSLTLALDARL